MFRNKIVDKFKQFGSIVISGHKNGDYMKIKSAAKSHA